eukprot:scaffold6806_cov63-Phaeocystis_antarctica.AAC.2
MGRPLRGVWLGDCGRIADLGGVLRAGLTKIENARRSGNKVAHTTCPHIPTSVPSARGRKRGMSVLSGPAADWRRVNADINSASTSNKKTNHVSKEGCTEACGRRRETCSSLVFRYNQRSEPL